MDCDDTEEESKEDDDIDYDQASLFVNSKLLLSKIIQVICLYFERACIQPRVITRLSEAENLRLRKQVNYYY